MSSVFEKRTKLKPYEYPELYGYVEAVRHSYWIHSEFNFTSDVQDFQSNTTQAEKSSIKRTMLAIAQIEIAVKTFWGDIYKRFPKPEIGAVGATFSESEVRHADAYAHLIEILGLNEEFEEITKVPAIMGRIAYLDKTMELAKTGSDKDYLRSVILFSLFVEHISLFSQFLIMMAFNKHRNMFKGISNAVEATSKEEQLHGMFGIDLVNIVRKENPEWFDKEMEEGLLRDCYKAYTAEEGILDWILEEGGMDFLKREEILEFMKERFNRSCESIGFKKPFETDKELVEKTSWFDDEVLTTKHTDFFYKRSTNYSKKKQSVTSDDLFD